MPSTTTRRAQRRLTRRAALRPDRLLTSAAMRAALNEPPPPTGLRTGAGSGASPAGGAPSLPPLGIIVLNRLAFGPRPGDLAAFNALGGSDLARLTAWVDQQLNPNAIADTDCANRISAAGFTSLNKSLAQLWTDHYLGGAGRSIPVTEVRNATLLRAVYSQRQLFEVLVDFWHNHFNIYAWDFAYASATWVHYDRDVIRANALGNFRQFIESVAKSTAMLYYLDNYLNQVAGSNENWARESFELHTLGAENYLGVMNPLDVPQENGVAVGYCDNDVYEAARCFTGWRVNNGSSGAPGNTGLFYYHNPWHDRFNKLVLGQYIPADQADLKDGQDILDLLASHPGTARHIARKLCRRLISDDPPQTVVDAAAAEFSAHVNSSDQLKRVVRVICLSNEFQAAWGEKVKRPFEATAGMLRAMQANFTPTNDIFYTFDQAGQALFSRRSPDGYPDHKDEWANTTSLLQRWRLANQLVQGWIDNTEINLLGQMPGGLTTANQIVDFWINRLLGRPMDPPENRNEIVNFLAQGFNPDFDLPGSQLTARLPHMVALILMSPDFQWR